MLNVVAIIGRLVANPELRTTPQGRNVTTVRIACDRSFTRQGEERQADFFDVVCWGNTADFVVKYFQKGSPIAVNGRLQSRQYQDKNGSNRYAVEIVASNVEFVPSSRNGNNSQNSDFSGYAPAAAPAYNSNSRPAAPQQPAAFSQGSNEDFAVIEDNEDLPF